MEANLNDRQLQALRLISTSGKGATEHANVLVSRQAPELLAMGMIVYAPARRWGYDLTGAGRQLI